VSLARVALQRSGANPNKFLGLLAHDIRWRLLGELSRSDRRVNELVALVGKRPNLVSYHLGVLRKHRLVSERRSSADARDVYYRFEQERFRTGFLASGSTLHPGLEGDGAGGGRSERVARLERTALQPRERVLFLCTGNSARSQMAEGILRHISEGSIDAESAGTRPRGVNPLAVKVLEPTIDISGQRSKHLDEFIRERFDYVITLCDRAREECPIFPGHPERIHWSFPDPAEVDGEQEREAAFRRTASELFTRLRYLIAMIERKRKSS
jgi:ArsR family transcriptional regulator, arsenate/arsenite/antimonite-responsive transcriptional repressor / arsenate reductase (thioredoxin)